MQDGFVSLGGAAADHEDPGIAAMSKVIRTTIDTATFRDYADNRVITGRQGEVRQRLLIYVEEAQRCLI